MINLLNDVGIFFLSNELYLTGKNKLKIVYYLSFQSPYG